MRLNVVSQFSLQSEASVAEERKRIADALRRAGQSLPLHENKGTVESAMATGLGHCADDCLCGRKSARQGVDDTRGWRQPFNEWGAD